MTTISPEQRAATMAVDFLDALAGNIQAYADVAQRTRIYRLYAFCRRHEAERRSFHSALAWLITGEAGAELRHPWHRRLHRLFVHLRIGRAKRIGPLILELREEDHQLRAAAEALLAEPGLDGGIWMVLGKLVSALRATDVESMAIIGNRHGSGQPVMASSQRESPLTPAGHS